MNCLLAGAFSGLVMASVSVCLGAIMLFFLTKDPTPRFQAILDRVPPMAMMTGLVVLAYPVWTIIGAVFGLLYKASTTQFPGWDMGSFNIIFTLAIVAIAVSAASSLALLLRRVLAGIASLTFVFVGLFGWVLPMLAR